MDDFKAIHGNSNIIELLSVIQSLSQSCIRTKGLSINFTLMETLNDIWSGNVISNMGHCNDGCIQQMENNLNNLCKSLRMPYMEMKMDLETLFDNDAWKLLAFTVQNMQIN